MGGAVSTGDDNDELVDNLVDADYIKSHKTERIFRAVDRAEYFLPEHRENAYKDLAWKHGHLHLSAPCIYSEVLESLELEEGLSFLNLGSGTGYLSTMAGLILGTYGVNHGVEVHHDVVEYANEKLEEFKQKSKAFEEYDFAEPQFVVGNCLMISSASRLYDRVYCGAACPAEHENYMRNLLKVGGILVMPLNDQLLQVKRVSETQWTSRSVLPVSFATLLTPSRDNKDNDVVELPDCHMMTLQDICRHNIRGIIRRLIIEEHPDILIPVRKPRAPKPKKSRKSVTRRGRLVNLIPMQMGMMYLDNLDSDEIDDSDDDDRLFYHRRHSADSSFECSEMECSLHLRRTRTNHHTASQQEGDEGGSGEPSTTTTTTNNNVDHEYEEVPTTSKPNPTENGLQASPFSQDDDMVEAGAVQQNHVEHCSPSTSNGSSDNKRSSPSSRLSESDSEDNNSASNKRMRCSDSEDEEELEKEVEKNGKGVEKDGHAMSREEMEEERDGNGFMEVGGAASSNSAPILIGLRCRHTQRRDRRSEGSDLDHMELDHGAEGEGSGTSTGSGPFQIPAAQTAVLNALNLLSIPRKFRCSSSTSADTADTSGFGSFGEEPLDLPGQSAERKNERSNGFHGSKRDESTSKDGGDSTDEEEAAESSSAKTVDEGPTLGQKMREHIELLPLPSALRAFLVYYRK